jgi:hypothetical protein
MRKDTPMTDAQSGASRQPPGVRPEDNEAGIESSLEKLARYVE